MTELVENFLEGSEQSYLPKTREIIEILSHEPTTAFICAHSANGPDHDDPAIGIFEVHGGCIGISDEVQPLCEQHAHSLPDGAAGLFWCVIDLTIGGTWSLPHHTQPDYIILLNPETEVLELVEVSS